MGVQSVICRYIMKLTALLGLRNFLIHLNIFIFCCTYIRVILAFESVLVYFHKSTNIYRCYLYVTQSNILFHFRLSFVGELSYHTLDSLSRVFNLSREAYFVYQLTMNKKSFFSYLSTSTSIGRSTLAIDYVKVHVFVFT